MKTELRAVPHKKIDGQTVFEIWHGEKCIGAIYGSKNRPGIMIVSELAIVEHHYTGKAPNAMDVDFY